jgi:N-acyl-phosphatidylethanolamine-hydrolysing phospholipase D
MDSNNWPTNYDIDLAIFNMGAYAPRWFMAPSHMNPSETVSAHFRRSRPGELMIAHWGTFQLGDEPVHFPPADLEKALGEKGLLRRWVPLGHGETFFF